MRTLAALLALLLIVSVSGQYSPTIDTCCGELKTSPIPVGKVVSYYTTSSRCSLEAHVLKTVAGREFCVSPKLDWVKKIIKKLDCKPSAASA